MSEEILVVGSMNLDMVFRSQRYPRKGETVIGQDFKTVPGGKGGNQAVAAGKLGGDVGFISACGEDRFGDILLKNLKENGVNTDYISRLEKTTGVAAITIEGDGDNRIIVVPGANGEISPGMINNYHRQLQQAEVVLLQMEIPLPTVIHTIELAAESDTAIVLDPAPAAELPENIFEKIDYLLPNEGELDLLTEKYKLESREKKAGKLLELGVKNVLVTAGEQGVFHYSESGKQHFPAFEVEVVDTTAAGDAFAGAFACGIQKQWSLPEAVEYAVIVAAMSVTKLGAQDSLPAREEVEKFRVANNRGDSR